MRSTTFKIQLLFVISILFSFPVIGQTIKIVADDFPPYNYIDVDGNITGVGTEVVKALLKELDIEANIQIVPWARAYQMALDESNVIMYTIVRSPQRENLFKWVGVVFEINACFFSLKKRNDININSLYDAKKYVIGATREDVRTQHMISQGFENLELTHTSEDNLKMVVSN